MRDVLSNKVARARLEREDAERQERDAALFASEENGQPPDPATASMDELRAYYGDTG